MSVFKSKIGRNAPLVDYAKYKINKYTQVSEIDESNFTDVNNAFIYKQNAQNNLEIYRTDGYVHIQTLCNADDVDNWCLYSLDSTFESYDE